MNKAKCGFLSAMAIFGTVGLCVENIPLPSATIACLRGVLGLVFLLGVMTLSGKKPDKLCIRQNLPILLLSGAAIGGNWILLFEAYRYTTIATATICYYLAPVFLVLASPLLGERLTPKKMLLSGTALLGISKPVVKAHGSSKAYAIRSAIRQLIRFTEAGVVQRVQENIEEMKIDLPGLEENC